MINFIRHIGEFALWFLGLLAVILVSMFIAIALGVSAENVINHVLK